jgi:methionyl-tRNA formyltransferase
VFAGTSSFAKLILEKLIKSKLVIISAIITQPDAEKGGKIGVKISPVKELAEKHGLPVLQPEKFDQEAIDQIKKISPDLIIVAAYGKILPEEILKIPDHGCLNIHASLLPKYRGPSPIQNALINGETKTGITIILMDKGIDTGDIIAQEAVDISPEDNSETLHYKLAAIGADILLKTIPMWLNKELKPLKQDHTKATFCQLIEREDGHIVWDDKADSIHNKFRALLPWPGVFSFWKINDALLRIKFTKISLEKNNPQTSHRLGEVFQLSDKIGVQTIEGVIILEELQIEGKKPVPIKDFLNGYPDFPGSVLI